MTFEIGDKVEVFFRAVDVLEVLLMQCRRMSSSNACTRIAEQTRCIVMEMVVKQVQGNARDGFPGAWTMATILAKDLGFVTVVYHDVRLQPYLQENKSVKLLSAASRLRGMQCSS